MVDWTQIIVALITVIGATVGTILVNLREKRKDAEARSAREAKAKEEREVKALAEKKEQAEQLESFKQEIIRTLEVHRSEYLNGIEKIDKRIDNVESNITDVQASYQQNTAVIELKIETLSNHVEKHNNVIERTYQLESDVKVLTQRETASESRIKKLEGNQ